MKTFGDLRVSGAAEAMSLLCQEIEKRLGDGWSRGVDKEKQLWSRDDERPLCFMCVKTAERESAGVFLYPDDSGGMYVSNIVPSERGSLSEEEYNAILSEFHDRFLLPAAQALGLTTELKGTEDVSLTYWTSADVTEKLRRFSLAANKSTGSMHPLDRDRFFEFLIASHRHGKPIPADVLQQWLVEEHGWDEETAIQLVIEYEFGTTLLGYYDRT